MNYLAALLALTLSSSASAQEVSLADPNPLAEAEADADADALPAPPEAFESVCSEDKVCVPIEDMQVIMQVLRERQCLELTEPSFEFSDVTIAVDRDGRIFYQGDPKDIQTPFTLQMNWCNFEVDARGPVKVTAAVSEPPTWGFRFRPKAYLGYSILTPLFDGKASRGIDAGLMLDFVHYRYLNLNLALGFRTFGVGLGLDITSNFGAYLGYGVSWKALIDPQVQPLSNVVLGLDFAF